MAEDNIGIAREKQEVYVTVRNMQYSHKYQHFALDANNNIIDIRNTSKLDTQRYSCPYCKKDMIPKRGNIRQWHFAHKTDKCSYDKYLHYIVEIMIINWFNREKTINLSMENYEKCYKYES